MLGIVSCGVGVWFLGRRAYRLVGEMSDARTRLKQEVKLISFKPVLLLLPLLVHYHSSGVERLTDGTTDHRSYGYGTDAAWVLPLLGTALIILFRIIVRLERAKVTDDDGAMGSVAV